MYKTHIKKNDRVDLNAEERVARKDSTIPVRHTRSIADSVSILYLYLNLTSEGCCRKSVSVFGSEKIKNWESTCILWIITGCDSLNMS